VDNFEWNGTSSSMRQQLNAPRAISCKYTNIVLWLLRFKQFTIHPRDDSMVFVINFKACSHLAVPPQDGTFRFHLKHHVILVEICKAEWRLAYTGECGEYLEYKQCDKNCKLPLASAKISAQKKTFNAIILDW
jgi:putative lipase involved disintegration of autophagic bodies